jgi:hypothetical protein
MAGINFKDGPGGRMKRAQQAQVLRVSSPNDPRLKAFQDSSSLYKEGLSPFMHFYDYGSGENLQPKENYVPYKNTLFGKKNIKKADITKDIQGIKDELKWQENRSVRKNLGDRLGLLNKSLKSGIYPTNMEYPDTYTANLIYKKPERTVIYDPRPKQPVIERMAPRQAEFPEIVAPAVRPMPMPVPVQELPPMMQEEAPVVPQEAAPAVVRRGPKAIMPTRGGGWSNQPLLMRMFPKLYAR